MIEMKAEMKGSPNAEMKKEMKVEMRGDIRWPGTCFILYMSEQNRKNASCAMIISLFCAGTELLQPGR